MASSNPLLARKVAALSVWFVVAASQSLKISEAHDGPRRMPAEEWNKPHHINHLDPGINHLEPGINHLYPDINHFDPDISHLDPHKVQKRSENCTGWSVAAFQDETLPGRNVATFQDETSSRAPTDSKHQIKMQG